MITVMGNVGNAGFALPMVSAYPVDPNVQQALVWDPTNQALNYGPFAINANGDFTVARDLFVTRNAVVTGTLGVTGVATFAAKPVMSLGFDSLLVNNGVPANGTISANGAITGATLNATTGGPAQVSGAGLSVAAVAVVGTRKTGWVAMTGTPIKATRATGTVTLADLAGIVMALQADMIAHGLIGT